MDFIPGTLDTLILRGLAWGPKHGYAVARWIEGCALGSLTVLGCALYTSLRRMEERGWVAAEWGESSTGRRARFYRLTPVGKKRLTAEMTDWSAYVNAVGLVLNSTT